MQLAIIHRLCELRTFNIKINFLLFIGFVGSGGLEDELDVNVFAMTALQYSNWEFHFQLLLLQMFFSWNDASICVFSDSERVERLLVGDGGVRSFCSWLWVFVFNAVQLLFQIRIGKRKFLLGVVFHDIKLLRECALLRLYFIKFRQLFIYQGIKVDLIIILQSKYGLFQGFEEIGLVLNIILCLQKFK